MNAPTSSKKRFMLTSALPYANGPLHFGHIAGVYLPADIYHRHLQQLGHEVAHICGSDEHGVAIMLSAEKEGKDYQSYVDGWHSNHKELFKKYGIEFDYFGRTSAEYHKTEVIEWFKALDEAGFIEKRPEKQLYCNDCPRFLPDRYVEGQCYVCQYETARGDECPNCGEWIEALKLKKPKCKICQSSNITAKESEHWYLLLSKFQTEFKKWFDTKKDWRPHVWQYTQSLLEQGLIDRAITRDLSWGIDVPVAHAEGKKLYVWFDAPIGYVSNTKQWLKEKGGTNTSEYLSHWWEFEDTEIVHFIGKDNIIFHALIWPCMIMGSQTRRQVKLPSNVAASHFVNLEGKQFSKSAGWYVDSETTIAELGQDAMRYYLSTIIPEINDTNFSWDNFLNGYNELGNKIGNFINRSCSFLAKHWPDGLSADSFQEALRAPEVSKIEEFRNNFVSALSNIKHQEALSLLMRLGESANEMFHLQEPWKTVKTDKTKAEVTLAISLFYIFAINSLFRPFLPHFSGKLIAYFGPNREKVSNLLNQFYRGQSLQSIRDEIFLNGFQLLIKPEPMFPRIESIAIEKFRLKS